MREATNDVICLSHLRWGFVYQRPNHLMSRFARDRRVFFVEEPIFDGAISRIVARAAAPNLSVVVPHLPEGLSQAEIDREQRRLLEGLIEDCEISDPILWFYTPMAFGFAGHVSAAAVVYDCMDELSAFRGAPPSLRNKEQQLLSRADVVFTGGYSLFESKRTQHPRVHPFPSSVDAAHFASSRQTTHDPDDQAPIAHPRIGYFGVIDERIDFDLIAHVADAQPSWQLVMIGPVVKVDPATLPQRPNIHWLGQKGYAELPSYLAGWEVALMPFALNESTRYISPTKTLEYLAAGKPVVSTPIHDVQHPYGDQGLVRIGDANEFEAQIAGALDESRGAPGARRARADAFVARTSWDDTHRRMLEVVSHAVRTRPRSMSANLHDGRQDADRNAESSREDRGEGNTTCSTI